jgi:hypothetical protein
MALILLSFFAITALQNHLITAHKEIDHKHFGMPLKADTICLYSAHESFITPHEMPWIQEMARNCLLLQSLGFLSSQSSL